MATNFTSGDTHMLTVFAGAFFGVLPDVVEGPYFFFNWKNKFVKNWLMFQKSIQADTTLVPGLATQLATIVAALWWVAG